MGLVSDCPRDAAESSLLARARREDKIELQARSVLQWMQSNAVVALLPRGDMRRSVQMLAPLACSRLAAARDLMSFSQVSRAHCRTLGQKEVVLPILNAVVRGFEQARRLADSAVQSIEHVSTEAAMAVERLCTLSRMQLNDLRLEATTKRARPCQQILLLASTLLQPMEKAQDDFAVQRLVTEGRLVDMATAFRPDLLHPTRRSRYLKAEAPCRSLLEATAVECTALGAVAQWLQAVRLQLEEHSMVATSYFQKEATLASIVPLARWVLRPQRCRLGRAILPDANTMGERMRSEQPRLWAHKMPGVPSHAAQRAQYAAAFAPAEGAQPCAVASVRQPSGAARGLDQNASTASTGREAEHAPHAHLALKQWLLEHGVPNHASTDGQPWMAPAAGQGATAVALLKASKESQARKQHSSACSTASTADGDRRVSASREDLLAAEGVFGASLDISSESDAAFEAGGVAPPSRRSGLQRM
mmetsp:Transcript_19724/g.35727  ORF Transcript_19724/g.35727 Transcript_19724/m.35727 type:complete len:476 (+) Transcript_19724:67-1494(+)